MTELQKATLREVVETLGWYRDEALAIHLNLQQKRHEAVLASIRVLSLDQGNRAAALIAILERNFP